MKPKDFAKKNEFHKYKFWKYILPIFKKDSKQKYYINHILSKQSVKQEKHLEGYNQSIKKYLFRVSKKPFWE